MKPKNPKLDILSSRSSLKYFNGDLSEKEIIDVLSDLKHRIFPRPFERIYKSTAKQNLVGVEIGVAGGEHSLSLLRSLNIKKLYCIDPYSLYENYDEGKMHYGVDQENLDITEKHAHNILSEYQTKLVWIRKISSSAILDIGEELDFVYIDGNHAEEYVREDIKNYYPLIKKGGVIGGHDYYNGYQYEHDGVIKAVTEFATKNCLNLKIELPDWWVIKN